VLPNDVVAEAAEIVIIGAGFAGAATAYHLARRGVRDVVILEAEPRAGVHASGKNAALCFQLIDDPDEARLAVEGTRTYADPPEDIAPRPLMRRQGSLLLASEGGRASLDAALRDARTLGVAATIVSRDDAIRRVPILARSPFVCALENADDGVVDIAALLRGYLEAARRRGARVRFGEPVKSVSVARGRIESVTTNRETISTRCLVDAAGPWAGEIARLAGIGMHSISPRRRHVFQLGVDARIEPGWPFVWHADLDVYFRPERGGVLASACDATPHPPATPAIDGGAESELRAKLGRAFPGLASLTVTEARACLRTFCADGRFLIGVDAALAGFFWVAALGGHGMSTSYGVGRLGAAAILGDRSPELERLSPARFGRAERP
jgi:D-arginine dehydrogenase